LLRTNIAETITLAGPDSGRIRRPDSFDAQASHYPAAM
jgi:hypothetical protein